MKCVDGRGRCGVVGEGWRGRKTAGGLDSEGGIGELRSFECEQRRYQSIARYLRKDEIMVC
jgi:hypothetical protein